MSIEEEKKPETPPPSIDPLKETYRENIVQAPGQIESLARQSTALLCIDMQYLDAAPGYGIFSASTADHWRNSHAYYFDRLENLVLPNVAKLQATFRKYKLEVIHTRIQSLTQDGRDRGPGHKRLGLHAPPGSKEAEFLEIVAPIGDEIIVDKTASGVFNSTNIEYLLRNLEISGLYVVGVYSNECVSTAVRDACDLGFYVTLISDGIATVTEELERATYTSMKDRYARVIPTEQAIAELESMFG
jgi:nicotinamidase-related amidase